MAVLCGALAGCGYHPLYATRSGGAGVPAELSAISIPEPKTRLEQIIRNDLLSDFQSSGAGGGRYVLSLAPSSRPETVVTNPKPSMHRYSYTLSVKYQLLEGAGGSVLTSGTSKAFVSYDDVTQPIAKMGNAADAEARAAHDVSEDIRTRIAAYFAGRG